MSPRRFDDLTGTAIVTLCQFWLSGRTSFLVCRALLGFIQGGFIPDLILYLSCTYKPGHLSAVLTHIPNTDYYTKTELPIRLAFFWMSSNVCSIVASFLAFGVLHMRGIHGKAGWRWLFLIEYVLRYDTIYTFSDTTVFTEAA